MTRSKETGDGLEREIERLKAKQREIEDRIAYIKEVESKKHRLLSYCQHNGFDRSDVMWVYQHLPLMRMTREQRLEQYLAQKGKPQKHKIPKAEYVQLGLKIRQLRNAKGWTSEQLAKKIGVHSSMLTAWERGVFRMTERPYKKLTTLLGPLPPLPPKMNRPTKPTKDGKPRARLGPRGAGIVMAKARVEKGMTPMDLAKAMKFNVTTIHKMERGELWPNEERAGQLSEILGPPPAAFLKPKE